MGISQLLCEVRDRDYGGEQKAMAAAWAIHESTLSRWIRRERVPTHTSYDFLAAKLGEDVNEVHRLCQNERNQREPATSTA
ncbi:hypothetical protein LCGC14_2948130 [marine sediment metagenome]|uniref:HTH cro/C1-type domain-containing protein n=1 Tax=marine sediment metagenome TaxID=412755 RepID=A0A0F9A790_9ZZZZ